MYTAALFWQFKMFQASAHLKAKRIKCKYGLVLSELLPVYFSSYVRVFFCYISCHLFEMYSKKGKKKTLEMPSPVVFLLLFKPYFRYNWMNSFRIRHYFKTFPFSPKCTRVSLSFSVCLLHKDIACLWIFCLHRTVWSCTRPTVGAKRETENLFVTWRYWTVRRW